MKALLRARAVLLLLCALLLAAGTAVSARAADEGRSYVFDLTVNGSHEVTVRPGDVLTVTLKLIRTDSEERSVIYGMQDELYYDDTFLEIQDESCLMWDGVKTSSVSQLTGGRMFYMNFLSFSGGADWPNVTPIGSFQVKILAETGSMRLKSEGCSVSTRDGSGSFEVAARDLYINLEGYSTVTFEPQNGRRSWDVSVKTGEKVQEPEAPLRDGFLFTGWYEDRELTTQWVFERDVVTNNMTLYAGWRAAETAADASALPDTAEPEPDEGAAPFPVWLAAALGAAVLLALLLLIFLRRRSSNRRTDEHKNDPE